MHPLFDERYLAQVYRYKRHNKWLALKSFIRRVRALLALRNEDKVVIEKELFPYFPAIFEWYLYFRGIRFVVDYDDAIFHNYDISSNRLIRLVFGNKIKKVVRYSSMVVAGNDYLKEKFVSFGANRVTVIPTVIDMKKYSIKVQGGSVFTIGWIGSPITFKYLYFLRGVFESLSARYKIRVVYIGANKTMGLPVEEFKEWDEAAEVVEIKKFDVGIMPLEDNIWERGKCGYKLIQYMGCAVPVIGTPIGINKEIIIDGYNGYKAITVEEWERYLEKLIKNSPEQNRQMGRNGRRVVEDHFSLQASQLKWLEVFNQSFSCNK